MTSIFFLETNKDIDVLYKHRSKDDILVAMAPLASYALEKKELPYKMLEGEYFSHLDLHNKMVGYHAEIKNIMKRLDNEIFKIDERFKKIDFGPFYSSLFDTGVPILCIISRIFEIRSILEKEKPTVVKIIDQGELVSDEVRFITVRGYKASVSYEGKGSLINKVIKLLKEYYNFELVIYAPDRREESRFLEAVKNDPPAFIRLDINKIKGNMLGLFGAAKNGLANSVFRVLSIAVAIFFVRKKANRILNVGCRELDCVKNKLMLKGWDIFAFPQTAFERNKTKRNYLFKNEFEHILTTDVNIKNLFVFSGIAYYNIIYKQLLNFSGRFETILLEYQWLERYLKEKNFHLSFFPSHTSFQSQNQLLPIILKKKKLPYVCWMHGGYGANKSVGSGFESSDFLLGDRYFVYGSRIKELIDRYYQKYNLKTYVAGSPSLESRYSGYTRPKNKKKSILYVLQPFAYPLNAVYTDECIRYRRFGYWPPIKAILRVLSKHQFDNHIRIRTHVGKEQLQLLRDYFKDKGICDIEIGTMSESILKDILFESDLVIFNAVSTSFFEASLTDADIFLLDDSDMTEAAERIINKRAFHARDIAGFCMKLDKYLQDGRFFQKNDHGYIKEFLDIDNRERRVEKLSQMFDAILAN